MSLNRNSLSERRTSRSEGTVCRSELAGSAMHEAWLSLEEARLGLDLRLRSLLTLRSAIVRTSTPVLGLLDAPVPVPELVALLLSGLRSFTVNLNGGLYTTCSRTRSLFFEAEALSAVGPHVVGPATVAVVVKLPTLRDFEPVSLFKFTWLFNPKNGML